MAQVPQRGSWAKIAKESFKEFKKQGLDFKLSSKLINAKDLKNSVKIKYHTNNKEHELEFDKLIVAVGRKPNLKDVINKDINLNLNNGFIEVDNFCQTKIPSIWAVGDVVRGPMLAHKGSE